MKAFLLLILCLPLGAVAEDRAGELTDAQIRRLIIQDSIRGYPGNCPCPYNVDRAGRRCGKRSAYSQPGGYTPVCYEGDITREMVSNYRRRAAK